MTIQEVAARGNRVGESIEIAGRDYRIIAVDGRMYARAVLRAASGREIRIGFEKLP